MEIILKNNIPLNNSQLSRFFGLTTEEILQIKNYLLVKEKLIDGYFLDGESEIQLTIPTTIDIIDMDEVKTTEDDYQSVVQRVDLVPEKDPLAIFHLTPLVMSDQSLIPSDRQVIGTRTWMILWDGIPAGYILKIPEKAGMPDYNMDIRLAKNLTTLPVISGAVQKFVEYMRSWYGEEGKLNSINGSAPRDRKWEALRFFFESIGINF